MKKTKVFAIMMATIITTTSLSTIAHAKTNNFNIPHETIVRGPGPVIPGTEDIIMQKTQWSRNVEMKNGLGFVISSVRLALVPMGGIKVLTNEVLNNIATFVGGWAVDKIVERYTTKVVDIKLDYYELRGADGKKRFQVYATYYDHNTGEFLESKLAQQGIVR